ncbi:MAG: exodeoxyribonuclease VII large subunit [bacterium]
MIIDHIYTVTDLTHNIKDILEGSLFDVWLEGEVSNLRIPASGHIYFTLKDENCQVRAVMFKTKNYFLRFAPEDGLHVLVSGRVTVYDKRGEYQINVDYMEPKGVGALQKAFEQLKERLFKEGLFDERHKKSIPILPQCIGIVTSSTGAALRDILNVIDRRFANVKILINPVSVQGEESANEIARAIQELNEKEEVEVIIVGRGGGSIEDLWAFNEEVVARAIYFSKAPIISAVGHETDYTIADFVADLRAPTPSAAAELVVRNKEELSQQVRFLQDRLSRTFKQVLIDQRNRLNIIMEQDIFKRPVKGIRERQQRVDELEMRLYRGLPQQLNSKLEKNQFLIDRLHLCNPQEQIASLKKEVKNQLSSLQRAMNHLLENYRNRFMILCGQLDVLSPLGILSRGYSICRRLPEYHVIKDIQQVSVGDKVGVLLKDGELVCKVESLGT